jgi:hypothetical protein
LRVGVVALHIDNVNERRAQRKAKKFMVCNFVVVVVKETENTLLLIALVHVLDKMRIRDGVTSRTGGTGLYIDRRDEEKGLPTEKGCPHLATRSRSPIIVSLETFIFVSSNARIKKFSFVMLITNKMRILR